MECGVELFCL